MAVIAFVALTGADANQQEVFATVARGDPLVLVVSTLSVGVLTRIGEEFRFRGVVASVLLCYGAVVGVVGTAVVFALLHGIDTIFPAALVAGLIAGEVLRRSASIWPAVMVHVVFNLPAMPVMTLIDAPQ